MSKPPDNIYLKRLIHIDNLDYILTIGKLTCLNHSENDSNYTNIGDTTLIRSRGTRDIPVNPGGNFSDYVAFYFGARPPMLYNIQNGFNQVTKRAPETIIYLVTSFIEVKKSRRPFVFTDGHAYHMMSQFYNKESDLKEVDWNAAKLFRWNDTEEDPDRKRRKQAEFLVYKELPVGALVAIVVYNNDAKSKVFSIFEKYDSALDVVVKPNWYY